MCKCHFSRECGWEPTPAAGDIFTGEMSPQSFSSHMFGRACVCVCVIRSWQASIDFTGEACYVPNTKLSPGLGAISSPSFVYEEEENVDSESVTDNSY